MLTNIISAMGNNSSIYPLLIRDCGIENAAKVILTYKQNAKESKTIARHAARERFIDEYGTSAVWLGGIPFIEKICNKIIKKRGFSPDTNIKLLKETAEQGMEYNINKFKDIAPKNVENLIKINNNKDLFKKIAGAKFLVTTLIPIGLMGYMLPKLNFKFTEKKRKKELERKRETGYAQKMFETFDSFYKNSDKKDVSFKGLSALADLSTLSKMKILDGGLTAGRVGTGRNFGEKAEMGFKMGGMYYLNYKAPKTIDKFLNKLTKFIFNINVNLDPKILKDAELISSPEKLFLPEKDLLLYIDNNPKSMFSKLAEKTGIIERIKTGARNPEKYVDTKKLEELKNNLLEYTDSLKKSANPKKLAQKAFAAKSFNIITNIIFSSFLLAAALPKAQFLFRKLITGSNLEPGIK